MNDFGIWDTHLGSYAWRATITAAEFRALNYPAPGYPQGRIMGAFSRLTPCQKGMVRTVRGPGVRSSHAALRGVRFGIEIRIAERRPIVSKVFCLAGSLFCQGLERAVAVAKRRPISRAEILGELEERTGLRVWSLPWGPVVGGSGHPDRMSCQYLDAVGILGLHPGGREVRRRPEIVPFEDGEYIKGNLVRTRYRELDSIARRLTIVRATIVAAFATKLKECQVDIEHGWRGAETGRFTTDKSNIEEGP